MGYAVVRSAVLGETRRDGKSWNYVKQEEIRMSMKQI